VVIHPNFNKPWQYFISSCWEETVSFWQWMKLIHNNIRSRTHKKCHPKGTIVTPNTIWHQIPYLSYCLCKFITVVTIPNMCTGTHNPEGKATTVKASKVDVTKPVVTNQCAPFSLAMWGVLALTINTPRRADVDIRHVGMIITPGRHPCSHLSLSLSLSLSKISVGLRVDWPRIWP
jgi:hypothetical protein